MYKAISVFSLTIILSLSHITFCQNKHLVELDQIGVNIEQSLMNNNPAYFNSLVNRQMLLEKVLINSRNSQVANFNMGFKNGFYQTFDLGNMLLSQIHDNGTYEYMRSYYKENEPVMLFRSFSNEGLNYHEFFMKKKDGEYTITDMYVFMTGELISDHFKRNYVANLYKILPEEADFYVEDEKYRTYKLLEKAQKLTGNGKHERAFRIWSKIPYSGKKEKMVQLTGIQIASFYNLDIYNQLSRKFEAEYPEDPGYYLFSLNGLYKQDAYDYSLTCLDSLDNLVGSDPMLDYIRAEIFTRMGKVNETITAYERLIESLPNFEPGYLEFFDFYIDKKDYKNALGVLDRMSFEFNYYKEDFTEFLKKYPSLTNSEVYSQWLEN